MERKVKLIEALQVERHKFVQMGSDVEEWDLAIKYLKNGIIPSNIDIEMYGLLDSAVNDFETLCNDYDC